MKSIKIYSLLLIFSMLSVQLNAGSGGAPAFQFENLKHDFGNIAQGDVVETVFKYTNSGDAPLIITDIITPCGCTTPLWTKAPIPPGGSGEITVRFNSKGKMGIQRKMLRILSNANGDNVIQINANVMPKSE